jgi:predicted metal-dependent peptidase
VAFTDGYIDVPKVTPHALAATLWVIGPRDRDPTRGSWGEVLRVDAEGYVV